MTKIGLSLGGGSLRGVAHIGVLQEFEDKGVTIDYLAGTSSGALIAGLYAAGISPNNMISLIHDLEWKRYIDVKFPTLALIKGKKIYKDLIRLTEGKHFKDLDIPLSVVCIDLTEGCLKVINTGEVAKAIRASIAIPGIFHPVKYNDHIYVDGYILNNNPADVVKNMGADYVVAVKVKGLVDNEPVKGIITSLKKYMNIASSLRTTEQLRENADVIIDINCEKFGKISLKTKQFLEMIKEGKDTTNQMIQDYNIVNLADYKMVSSISNID